MIRRATEQDAATLGRLLATDFGEVRDHQVRAALKAPRTIMLVDDAIPAMCRIQHYTLEQRYGPVPPGPATQIAELLPQTEGLFTDGTMPRLLMKTLVAFGAAYPEVLDDPCWGQLRNAQDALKYRPLFAGSRVQGRIIWILRLRQAVDVARLAGGS